MNSNRIILMILSLLIVSACQQDTETTANQETEPQQNQPTQVEPTTPLDTVNQEPAVSPLQENFERSARTLFYARPHYATVLGVDESLAGGKYNHRLDDYSPAAEAQLRQQMRLINDKLANMETTNLVDVSNQKVMMNLNRYFSGHEDFDIGYIDMWMGLSPFVVNQINGPLIDVPNFMATNQKIKQAQDAEDYLQRLAGFGAFIQSVEAKLAADNAKGWIAPKVLIEKAIAGLEAFIAPEPTAHPLYTSLSTQLDAMADVDDEQKSQWLSQAEQHIKAQVYPGYRSVISGQQALLDQAPTTAGIWAQPNGEAYYADAVKMLGDSDLSPAEIHQLGLDEVDRISNEMDAILSANGYPDGTVGERMLAINDEPQFLYEDSTAGRAELIADLNGYIDEINQRMPELFATKPPYEVEVRAFPKAREASAPGGMYTNPALDGSQPGIYWINLRDIKANAKFDLKTLTYHEANPGHHWQIALNMAQDQLPMVRRIAPYNAYVEGWALYSELVAKEMGMYDGDPFGDLGRLKAELFRAVRLVVDTGLHHQKWTREQAIKYMAEASGTVESDVVAEIERYMAWPGQALGYKMGMIKIAELRTKAQEALGEQFDIKAFHDMVLLGGAVPMAVLEEQVNDWIKGQQIQ